MPSGSTLTGRRAKEAEARHKMCAPVASTSRAKVWDRKLRSASVSIPGVNTASRSRAWVCSPTV